MMIGKKSQNPYFFPSTLNTPVSFKNILKVSTTSNTTLVAAQLSFPEVEKVVRSNIWDAMIKLRGRLISGGPEITFSPLTCARSNESL